MDTNPQGCRHAAKGMGSILEVICLASCLDDDGQNVLASVEDAAE
jgi:hypothetical protein